MFGLGSFTVYIQIPVSWLLRRTSLFWVWPSKVAFAFALCLCLESVSLSMEPSAPKPLCELVRVPTRCLAFGSGGDTIALGGHDERGALITVIETGSWRQVTKMPLIGRSVNAVAFSPDSPLLFVAVGSEVVVLNLAEWKLQTRLLRHTGIVFDIAVSSANQNIATTGDDGRICIWDRKKLEHVTDLKSKGTPIYSAAFDTSGKELAVAGRDQLRVWNRLGKESFIDVKMDASPSCVRFASECNRVIAVSGTGEIIIMNREDLRQQPDTHDIGSFIEDFDCIAGTKRLIIAVGRDLALFDVPKAKVLRRFRAFDSRVRVVRCDQTTMRVAATSWEGQLKVWDASELMKEQEPVR